LWIGLTGFALFAFGAFFQPSALAQGLQSFSDVLCEVSRVYKIALFFLLFVLLSV
jgi:hypothetical protein